MTRAGYRSSDNGTTSRLIFGNGESESPHDEEKVDDSDDPMFDVEALNYAGELLFNSLQFVQHRLCTGTKMAMRKGE